MKLNGHVFNPGELRTLIILASRTATQDAGGFQKASNPFIAQVWAKWENVHGQEVWAADARAAESAATVTIRYRDDVDATCVLIKDATAEEVIDEKGVVTGWTYTGGRAYEIVGDPDDIQELHEYLEIKVKRMKAG